MQKFIYYHRHGETHFTAKKQGYGDHQYRALLTRLGQQEVKMLGAALARRGPFDLYLTSPLPRAVQSATIVHGYLNNEVDLQIEPDLIEPINESSTDTWKRITRLAQRLVAGKEQKVLLSTHGYLCIYLSAYFRGNTLSDIHTFANPPTASFGWVELKDGQPLRGCRISDGHLADLSNSLR
ncbi:MAG: histidine phosphatase family protein [Chloroflexi bacterium]|nr:histidine phosphatase family protein [Chloroflexota bacterium]